MDLREHNIGVISRRDDDPPEDPETIEEHPAVEACLRQVLDLIEQETLRLRPDLGALDEDGQPLVRDDEWGELEDAVVLHIVQMAAALYRQGREDEALDQSVADMNRREDEALERMEEEERSSPGGYGPGT